MLFFDLFLEHVGKQSLSDVNLRDRQDAGDILNWKANSMLWSDFMLAEDQSQFWMIHGIQVKNTKINRIYHKGNSYANENFYTMLTAVWLVTCLNLSREYNIKDIERVFCDKIGKDFWSTIDKFPGKPHVSDIDVDEDGYGLGSLVTILKYKIGGFGQYESRNIKLIHSSVANNQKLGHLQNAHTLDELFPRSINKRGLIVKNNSNKQFTLTFFKKQIDDTDFLCLYMYVPDTPDGSPYAIFLRANLEEIKAFMFGSEGDTENNQKRFNATYFKKAEDNGDEVITSMLSTHAQVYPSNTA